MISDKDAKIKELEGKVERAKSFIEMIAYWDYPNSLKGRAPEQIDWVVFKAAEALKEIEGSEEPQEDIKF